MFFTCDSHEQLLPLEQAIQRFAGAIASTSVSSTLTCLEVMADGVSERPCALEAVAKKLGYSLKDCIAFGNGVDDAKCCRWRGKAALWAVRTSV
ncbi:HAD hydrolase family protein [Shigella flexneri]